MSDDGAPFVCRREIDASSEVYEGGVSLATAPVVVGGGRGVGSAEGFDVDKAWAANAAKYKTMGREAISAALREKADKGAPIPSFSAGVTFVDVAVHTQDVRRGLGIEGSLDPEVLQASLDWVTTHKQRKLHVDPKITDTLRLEATDIDWSWGEGALVSGPAEAILMGLNRRDMSAELTGDGVAELPK